MKEDLQLKKYDHYVNTSNFSFTIDVQYVYLRLHKYAG